MKEKTMETITAEERAAHIIDMCHRMTVHHTLWFREAEHQLGFEKALNVMDYAWKQTRKAAVRRLAAQFHFPEQEGCPAFLIRLPKEEQAFSSGHHRKKLACPRRLLVSGSGVFLRHQ